jgi:hypothetical protein
LAVNNSNFMTLVDLDHNNGASERVPIAGVRRMVSADDGTLWVVKTSDEQNSLVEFDVQRGQLTEETIINIQGPIKQAKVGPNGWFYALIH